MNPYILYLSTTMVFTALLITAPSQERVRSQAPSETGAVIRQKGERRILNDSKAVEAIMAQVLKEENPKHGRQITDEGRRLALTMQAKAVGLMPEDVDRAIREWGRQVKDPYQQGLVALYEKDFKTATRLLAQFYEGRKESSQKAGTDLADAAFFLGQSLYGQEKYGAAADKFREVISLREDDPDVLNWLGISLLRITEYAEAEPHLERAIEMREKKLGENHPSTATSLVNLAGLYYAQRKPGEAEPLLERALEIREKRLGKDHPSLAAALQDLAAVYQSQGKFGEAEPLLRRAIEIQEKALGKYHPSIIHILNRLAQVYNNEAKREQAEPLYRRVIEINEQALGKDHPSIAESLHLLAEHYDSRGKYGEAESLYLRAIEINEQALGEKHPSTSHIRESLERLHTKRRRY